MAPQAIPCMHTGSSVFSGSPAAVQTEEDYPRIRSAPVPLTPFAALPAAVLPVPHGHNNGQQQTSNEALNDSSTGWHGREFVPAVRPAPIPERWIISMERIVKKAVLAAVTAVAMAASLSAVTTTNASAIEQIDCGPRGLLALDLHDSFMGVSSRYRTECFANAGSHDIKPLSDVQDVWLSKITTGDNRARYFGDGGWSDPIDKWTTYTWPNAVDISAIEIL
jgi:hypothetical protein